MGNCDSTPRGALYGCDACPRRRKLSNNDRNTGSSFASFLEEEGILEEVDALAIKRFIGLRG